MKFRAIPKAKNIGEYMKRMSARPHHLGSAYDAETEIARVAKALERETALLESASGELEQAR